MATTTTGSGLTITRGAVNVMADGTTIIHLEYKNGAGGLVHHRVLIVAADNSAVTDNFGNVIAAPVPAGLVTLLTNFASTLDTMIGNAATAGKLNL